jgi:hypothetical protein
VDARKKGGGDFFGPGDVPTDEQLIHFFKGGRAWKVGAFQIGKLPLSLRDKRRIKAEGRSRQERDRNRSPEDRMMQPDKVAEAYERWKTSGKMRTGPADGDIARQTLLGLLDEEFRKQDPAKFGSVGARREAAFAAVNDWLSGEYGIRALRSMARNAGWPILLTPPS